MILFGSSGHCKVILDILFQNNIEVKIIYDDLPLVVSIFDIPVVKNEGLFQNEKAIISIGNNAVRKIISEKYSLKFVSAVHPSAIVSSFTSIGIGTVIMALVAINPAVKIGNHCIINTGAIIEHDCCIEDFVHVCPKAAIAGNVKVGEGSQIGIGATIIQGVTIGKWCMIGAGAVILNDIPDGSVVVGNPGRIIKTNPIVY